MQPILVRRAELSLPNLSLEVRSESLPVDVEWSEAYDRHLVIINVGGRTERMDARLETGGRYLGPPMLGEMSIVPAGYRFGGIYGGGTIAYANIWLSAAGSRLNQLRPRLMHFDRRIFEPARHLASFAFRRGNADCLQMEEQAEQLASALGQTPNSTPRSATIPLHRRAADHLQDFIHQNLQERITLRHLAEVAHIPTHHLLRRFRLSFGTTPAQYVIDQRVRRARWLLAHTRMSGQSIALLLGFASQAHFCQTFSVRVGCPPLVYREAIRVCKVVPESGPVT